MQKIKLLTISILATLVICSAIQISAAQDTPTTPPGTTSSTHSPQQGPPVEGDQYAPDVGLAPIYEHDGQPAFGVNEPNNNDGPYGLDSSQPMTTGEKPQLYGANTQEAQDKNTTAQDNTTLYITVGGAVGAIAVGGAVGFVYYRKTKN